jgi:hypothetical protein
MRRFLSNVVAAMVLGLALMATAQAGQKYGSYNHEHSRSYHETYGTKFKYGYYYKGYDHHHWTYSYWWSKYGCYTYWCPSTSCWYYWYPREERYYPVSYISTATPVAQPTPPGVETNVKQIVNVTNNSPGSATAGAGKAGTAGTPLPAAPMPPSQP